MPDPLQKMVQMVSLKNMLSDSAARQALLPLQQQEMQGRIQQQQTANQMSQLELDSQKNMMNAIAGGALNKYAGVETEDGTGLDAAKAYQDLVANHGVLPAHAQQLITGFQTVDKNAAEIRKNLGEANTSYLKNRAESHKQMAEDLADVMDSENPGLALSVMKAEYQKTPPPGIDRNDLALFNQADLAHIPAIAGMLRLDGQIESYHAERAKSRRQAVTASAPSQQQVYDATQTLNAYQVIPTALRNGLANEMKNAPDMETLQKIQARADAASESFERSADARQQAMAMKDVGLQNLVAGKLVAEDEKLGATLDNSKGIRDLLTQNLEGNQTALAAAQVRFAGHEIKEGGINRITQTEINSQTKGVGDFARQLQTWADKGFAGKAPVAGVQEMRAILDMEDKAATNSHQRNVDTITNRYFGKNTSSGAAATQAPSGPPPGATHTVLNRTDGKKHWTDAQNSKDLGVAE
jgi:hypothetical protein